MPPNVQLHPLADKALKRLKARLEAEEGRTASERQIVSALVYGITPAQAAGMLIAFTRDAAPPNQGDKETA